MVNRVADNQIVLRFGGGVHSRASEEDINERECADGQNFELDADNFTLRNRKPFDLIGTAANGSEIRGFVTLTKTDGTSKMAVQAGDKVYEWNGSTLGTTAIATVASTAKLRGRLEHNWLLDDKVIITDLNSQENLTEWNGTTWQDVAVTKTQSGSQVSFGDFKARYCFVANERAFYGYIVDDSATTSPHLFVGSERSDFQHISIADRPASSLAESDPFFLVQPDNRPINGMVEAFGVVVTSSENGSIYQLTGSTSKDFNMSELHPRSGASGDESVAYVGNDIFYGRQARIESLSATDQFGDVEQNDLTFVIADKLEGLKGWTMAYNSRTQRLYAYPENGSQIFVLHKPLMGSGLSPWILFQTAHANGFSITAMMPCIDPADGLEYIFWGDSAGRVFRMEGSGTDGDGGSASIRLESLSKLFVAPLGEVAKVDGWIKYRKNEAATVRLRFEFSGENAFDNEITIDVQALSRNNFYGGGKYYGGGNYYSTPFEGRLVRQPWIIGAGSTEFQVRVIVEGKTDIEISEVGIRFSQV